MKVLVGREIELSDNLSPKVKTELKRVTSGLVCEKWFNSYFEACKQLEVRDIVLKRDDLYKAANLLIAKNDKNGELLRWAAANLPPDKLGTVRASLNEPYRPNHGESHIENPSVVVAMVMNKL